MSAIRLAAWTLAATMIAAPAIAGQSVIPNYDTSRDDYFWPQLYALGGVTMYFDHVFPGNEIYEAVGGNRRSTAGDRLTVGGTSRPGTYPT